MLLYDRVFERTKIKMKAQVTLHRKALVLIYTLFKKNEPFISDYENIKANKNTSSQEGRQDISPTYFGGLHKMQPPCAYKLIFFSKNSCF